MSSYILSLIILGCVTGGCSTYVPPTEEQVLIAERECPLTRIVINGHGWDSMDHERLIYSRARCEYLYPNSPCVIEFRKSGPRSYQVICGRMR